MRLPAKVLALGLVAAALAILAIQYDFSQRARVREDGLALAREGRFAEAEPHLRSAAEANNADVEVLRALALGYMGAARAFEAEVYLHRWCELAPGVVEPLYERMMWLQSRGRVPEAIADGLRVLRIEPRHQEVLKEVVLMLIHEGRHAEAEGLCRGHLQTNPGHSGLLYCLAEACHRQGKDQEAVAILDPLIAADPQYVAPVLLRAVLYAESGKEQEAIPLLRKALARHPGNKMAHYHLGQALARMGQPEEAARAMAEFLKLDELERLEKDSEIQANNLPLQLRYAEALFNHNRRRDGLVVLQRILRQDPGHAAARRLQAAIEMKP